MNFIQEINIQAVGIMPIAVTKEGMWLHMREVQPEATGPLQSVTPQLCQVGLPSEGPLWVGLPASTSCHLLYAPPAVSNIF